MNYWQNKWTEEAVAFKSRLLIRNIDTETRPIRHEEVILCRLRSDATMLTHMLPRIERRFPPICEECNELLTIEHVLVDCIMYIQERREITEYFRIKNKRLTAFNLLQDDITIVDMLMKYIRNTDLISQL